jgi:putative ABC transport system permease protein
VTRTVTVFLAETARDLLAQVTASLLALGAIAGMCTWMVTTAGREEATNAAVLATIDDQGTRTIVVRAGADTHLLTPTLVTALGQTGQVEQAVGFTGTTSIDVQVAPRPEDIGFRTVVLAPFPEDQTPTMQGELWATDSGLASLGLAGGPGAVMTDAGTELMVRGPFEAPTAAQFLEPLIFRELPSTDTAVQGLGLTTVVVVARSSSDVSSLTDLVVAMIDPGDPTMLTVETSEQLAAVRGAVADSLDTSSRTAIAASLGGSALMVMVTFLAVTLVRRKDFGRRRALGASRMFIVAMLETQAVLLGAMGGLLGALVGWTVLAVQRQPAPSATYLAAVTFMAMFSALVGGIVPALVASTRDPLTELRTP